MNVIQMKVPVRAEKKGNVLFVFTPLELEYEMVKTE